MSCLPPNWNSLTAQKQPYYIQRRLILLLIITRRTIIDKPLPGTIFNFSQLRARNYPLRRVDSELPERLSCTEFSGRTWIEGAREPVMCAYPIRALKR